MGNSIGDCCALLRVVLSNEDADEFSSWESGKTMDTIDPSGCSFSCWSLDSPSYFVCMWTYVGCLSRLVDGSMACGGDDVAPCDSKG